MNKRKLYLRRLVIAAMLAALALICFDYLRLEIPIGDSTGKIYVGHVFVILAGIMLGPVYGAAVGGIGLMLSDLLTGYFTSAFPTLLAKAILGMAAGLFAGLLFHGKTEPSTGKLIGKYAAVAALSTVVNVLTEPGIRYLFKIYVLKYEREVVVVASIGCALSMLVSGIASTVIVALLAKVADMLQKKYLRA